MGGKQCQLAFDECNGTGAGSSEIQNVWYHPPCSARAPWMRETRSMSRDWLRLWVRMQGPLWPVGQEQKTVKAGSKTMHLLVGCVYLEHTRVGSCSYCILWHRTSPEEGS